MIDWNDAPEWATKYATLNGHKDWYYWIGDKGYLFFGASDFCEFGASDASTEYFLIGDFDIIESRPVITKPVYTQAMCDAGELPSVGMECMYFDVYNTLVEIMYISEWCVVFKQLTEGYAKDVELCKMIVDLDIQFKPITPPIELIDGKAYQFQYQSCRGLGFYNERLNEFSSLNHKVDIDNCINIKLLEVKS